jgi:hypothetical protein
MLGRKRLERLSNAPKVASRLLHVALLEHEVELYAGTRPVHRLRDQIKLRAEKLSVQRQQRSVGLRPRRDRRAGVGYQHNANIGHRPC